MGLFSHIQVIKNRKFLYVQKFLMQEIIWTYISCQKMILRCQMELFVTENKLPAEPIMNRLETGEKTFAFTQQINADWNFIQSHNN